MCNRFLKFIQGKYVAEPLTYAKPTSEMTPQEIHEGLKAWFSSPGNWLGRKGATMFLTNRRGPIAIARRKGAKYRCEKAYCK